MTSDLTLAFTLDFKETLDDFIEDGAINCCNALWLCAILNFSCWAKTEKDFQLQVHACELLMNTHA